MKRTRRILAVALCILMLAALSAPAMATEPGGYSPATSHTFVTYQVFSGTQADGDTKLADIQWGSGVNAAGFVAAIQSDPTIGGLFAGITVGTLDGYGRDLSAKRVAEVIAEQGWDFDSEQAQTLARAAYANRVGTPGGTTGLASGYYLVVDTTTVADGDYVNIALLQVTSGGTVDTWQKVSAPTVQKKVTDKDDSTSGTETNLDSADYDIGDDVPFTITANIGMISHFEQYKVIFHDTLSAGLTYNNDAEIVLINPNGTYKTVTNLFTITASGGELTFQCNDILNPAVGAMSNSIIVINYTAKLNENAVIGEGGNPNTVYLEYSNNPNRTDTGEINPSTDNTVEDKVVVYTYQVVLTKVDESGNPLSGASFDLYKKVGTNYVKVENLVSVENGTVFSFKGLDAGDYRLVETAAPAGYNSIEPIEFTIAATHSTTADAPELLTLTCTVTKWDPEMGTTAPALGADLPTGTVSGNVVNVVGLLLPETGGIGTTIFYVVGGLIMLCAVVVLVTRKRMEGTV